MSNSKLPLQAYLPATLKISKSKFYIEYYTLHPQDNTMKRMRVRLTHLRKRCKTLKEFKAIAYERINIINNKLAGGWTPFFESENSRYYTPLLDVIDLYLQEKTKELRAATIASYRSGCSLLAKWCKENTPDIYIGMFNRVHAVKYLDAIYQGSMTARTWNNRLKMSRAFFEWALQKCYCSENPFAGIKIKREEIKKRVMISQEVRGRIIDWYNENNPVMTAVCLLVFNSLIRPKEITELRIADIDVENHHIRITAKNAKNHKERFAAISVDIEEYFKKQNLGSYPMDYYVVGSSGRIHKNKIALNYFVKWWDKMRKELKLPQEMQLYSLRDTGINELLKSGVDPLTVMQHADHHDLTMTTRYANHADPKLIATMYERAVKF